MSPNSQSTTDYLRQEYLRRGKEATVLLKQHHAATNDANRVSAMWRHAIYNDPDSCDGLLDEYRTLAAERDQAWHEYRNASEREWAAYTRYMHYSRTGRDLAGVEA